MNELLALRDVLSGYMQEEKRGAFIEDFDSLLAKHDTSDVWRQFAIWMLVDPEHGVLKFTEPGTDDYFVIQRVAQLYIDDCKDREEFFNAHLYAVAAAFDDDEDDPHFASYHAALVAVDAARAAAHAYANAAGGNYHYHIMADKLIDLIKKSPEAT